MSYIVIHYPEPSGDNVYQVNEEDQPHFLATMNRALYLSRPGSDAGVRCVEIYLRERSQPRVTTEGKVYDEGGWLEHAIVVNYEGPGNRRLTVGAIQRKVGARSEFHS